MIPFITHGGQDFLYSLDTIKAELPGIEVIKGFACAAAYIGSAMHVVASFLEENKGILD